MSSADVPCPGSSGSSVANPAAANACASPRIDCGHPVKPCTTRAPCGPPAAENGSAPGSTSVIRVLRAERVLPPVVGRRVPVGVGNDAVDRAHGRQALLAPRAELGEDDHVDAVVEDGAELRRAVAQARVAVDADRHVDLERGVLPLLVALTRLDALRTGTGGHEPSVERPPGQAYRRQSPRSAGLRGL